MSALDASGRWRSLVSLATLGLARSPLPREGFWPDDALAPAADAPPGTALLRAAAASDVWRIAGVRSAPGTLPATQPAPPPAPRVVSEAAAWRLGRMLAGDHRDLVPEWFELAARAGAVLPPHWLPVVFEALDAATRQRLAAVLGPHGAWLAARNADWAFRAADAEITDDQWVNGTFDERRAVLEELRQRDPSRAREWIERTWSEDPAEARAAFVRALAAGLGPEDEPLLERALDDKRKNVRLAAAECLARLPGSAHAVRTFERLRPLVRLLPQKKGLLARFAGRRLEIALPEALDAAAIRDGIEPKPPAQRKIGERTYWLVQMIAMVPPMHWTDAFGCDAATLVDAALETEYADDLLDAFIAAAARHPGGEWTAALCERVIQRRAADDAARVGQTLAALIDALPTGARDPLFRTAAETLGPARVQDVLALTGGADVRWSAETTAAFESRGKRVLWLSGESCRSAAQMMRERSRAAERVATARTAKFAKRHQKSADNGGAGGCEDQGGAAPLAARDGTD